MSIISGHSDIELNTTGVTGSRQNVDSHSTEYNSWVLQLSTCVGFLDRWQDVGRFCECWVLPAYEEQVRSNEGYGRNVLLESAEFSLLIHKLVQCFQCEMISSGEKAFGRHLEAIHCAFVVCAVSDEMSIFIALL